MNYWFIETSTWSNNKNADGFQSPNSPCRQILNDGTGEQELNRVLVIIAVTLEGSARRLVTIRSALQVTNDLEETIELNLVPPPFNLLANKLVRVPPCTTYAIPMTHLMSEVVSSISFLSFFFPIFPHFHIALKCGSYEAGVASRSDSTGMNVIFICFRFLCARMPRNCRIRTLSVTNRSNGKASSRRPTARACAIR